jgi:hypothetical protein
MERESDSAATWRLPVKSLLTAFLLWCLDAFAMNQFLISGGMVLVALVVLVPMALASALHRDRRALGTRAIRAAAFGLAGLGGIAAIVAQNRLARGRAEVVIDACERYRATTGRYPDHLAELVPAYLPSVPPAKPFAVFGDFWYLAHEDRHTLFYVELPPFGRPTYAFEEKRWGYLD